MSFGRDDYDCDFVKIAKITTGILIKAVKDELKSNDNFGKNIGRRGDKLVFMSRKSKKRASLHGNFLRYGFTDTLKIKHYY